MLALQQMEDHLAISKLTTLPQNPNSYSDYIKVFLIWTYQYYYFFYWKQMTNIISATNKGTYVYVTSFIYII